MALASNVESEIEDVINAVAADPALTAEVIRIANSPAYGLSGKIGDLRQAVVMLGLAEVRNVAAALVMLSTFGGSGAEASEMHTQCVLAGSIGSLIACDLRSVSRSEAWLAGTLCEIGALACLAVDPDGFRSIYGACGLDFELRDRRETTAYGAPSREIGARLLQRNGLPESIVEAVRGDIDDAALTTRVAWLSRRLSPHLLQAGFTGDLEALDASIGELQLQSGLPLDPAKVRAACMSAGELTEKGLRGDGSLLPPADKKSAAPKPRTLDIADQAGRKKSFKKRRWALW